MKKLALMMVALVAVFSMAVAGSNITIKGSDTLVRLGQRWAEEYMKTNSETVIQVSGGGSGTGIAALLNGTTDVCEASRDMKEKEYKLAKDKGIDVYRISVALDGIAVFLNEGNPVNELSIPQLKGIYTGAITNWKEVGGKDARIILYGRENNSGTYAFFKEHVLDKEDYDAHTQTLPGTAAVVNAVAEDVNGIGYGGIAWAKGVKYASVKKDDTTAAVMPSVETVSNGTYPISRELYWFFNGKPTGDLQKLTNWALSEAGQKLSEEIGYVPLLKEMAEANMVK
ncbi:MAG TPA: phosphate ABC transporter substrate-binding protein [candidate division Zixibacteria bacterium]|nr:phosphate ABC transporter substrate-binding protein [candidate division Zixibacteria bacterium]